MAINQVTPQAWAARRNIMLSAWKDRLSLNLDVSCSPIDTLDGTFDGSITLGKARVSSIAEIKGTHVLNRRFFSHHTGARKMTCSLASTPINPVRAKRRKDLLHRAYIMTDKHISPKASVRKGLW
jgi:hypothetical protein